MLALWPADSRTGRRVANNFVSTDPNTYSSANGIVKVDHNFNSMHSLSARYFGGGGDQVAQTNSPYLRLLPGGAEPDAQRLARRDQRLHLAPGQPAGGRLQLLQADVQLERHLGRSAGDGLQHRRHRSRRWPARRTSRSTGSPRSAARSRSAASTRRCHFTDSMSYSTGAHQMKFGGEVRAWPTCSSSTTATSAAPSPTTARSGRGRRCRRRRRARR